MRYSFVVPIYNDGALASAFCRELRDVFVRRLGKDDIEEDVEVVFVDDGSKNDSLRALKAACDEHRFARVFSLSRNFGQHIAISCGYANARGEYVGYLNVDQEDPPDQLLVLLDALEANPEWDIAGGLYEHRDVPLLARATSWAFNVVMTRLTGYDSPTNAATVRIMRRRFVDAYNALTERSRFIPGLEQWLGFKYGRVPVRHQRRRDGGSSYNFRKRLRMAIESIISFSDYPLRLTVKFGFAAAGIGALLALVMIVDRLFFHAFLPGWVSTIAAIVLFGGLQILVIGIASLYIGRVLAEVQGRPLYIVRETYGASTKS